MSDTFNITDKFLFSSIPSMTYHQEMKPYSDLQNNLVRFPACSGLPLYECWVLWKVGKIFCGSSLDDPDGTRPWFWPTRSNGGLRGKSKLARVPGGLELDCRQRHPQSCATRT